MNGCEANLQTDAANCGKCGAGCGPGLSCVAGICTCVQCNIPHASASCANNACMFQSCNPGWANCDGSLADGCEVDTTSDPKNCGGCNNACPSGQFCVSGACKVAPRCPNVMFVFDDTGSTASTPDGTGVGPSKLMLEIEAVTNVLNLYPNAAPYGLEIFTSSALSDLQCYADTSIAIEPALGSAAAIKTAIAPLTAMGGSNVGEAVKRAASDPRLADPSRDNIIFLTTDGGFNCNSMDQTTMGAWTISVVAAAAAQTPPVKTMVLGFDQAGDGPAMTYNQMAVDGQLAQPGCSATTNPCYYPISTNTTGVVQKAIERILYVQNGVPQCAP
jgi:hypothetical protein